MIIHQCWVPLAFGILMGTLMLDVLAFGMLIRYWERLGVLLFLWYSIYSWSLVNKYTTYTSWLTSGMSHTFTRHLGYRYILYDISHLRWNRHWRLGVGYCNNLYEHPECWKNIWNTISRFDMGHELLIMVVVYVVCLVLIGYLLIEYVSLIVFLFVTL